MSVNNDDQQELDSPDTLSLKDYHGSEDERHLNPSFSTTDQELFEFCNARSSEWIIEQQHRMSHAEDMFSKGKLIPINDQKQDQKQSNETCNKKHIHRRRSESMHELKTTTHKATTSQLVRNSYSLDYKKLNRNSRSNYDSEIHRNNLSTKTSSSRWSDLVFAPLKGPPEMDLRDIRNRQIVNTSKSLFPTVDSSDRFAVSRVGCHRKTSWGVLGILSCKSSGSVGVSLPLSYEKLSLKN
ncbi:hypothetical protein QVD17_29798 [Tagetes erecta]|uniref:Uncharacterized protein n=1 Tax=Tagetes erecta TaxID=13708 RepID=A0AAD8NFG5_TARER|nr:hypothetical protein QVD17_29798 [Tagetes erecta]